MHSCLLNSYMHLTSILKPKAGFGYFKRIKFYRGHAFFSALVPHHASPEPQHLQSHKSYFSVVLPYLKQNWRKG